MHLILIGISLGVVGVFAWQVDLLLSVLAVADGVVAALVGDGQ